MFHNVGLQPAVNQQTLVDENKTPDLDADPEPSISETPLTPVVSKKENLVRSTFSRPRLCVE
jgi:hypothetical protein